MSMNRICRVCHKTTGRAVCPTCRKVANLKIHSQLAVASGKAPWVEAVRKRLFKT